MVKDIMCGDEAAAARSMLQITYPVWLSGFLQKHIRRALDTDHQPV